MEDKKFHVNNEGNVGKCTASVRDCEFGESNHYESEAEAKSGYEKKMNNKSISVPVKRSLWENQKIPMFSNIDKAYKAKTMGEAVVRLKTEVESVRNAEEYTVSDLLEDNGYVKYKEASYVYCTVEDANIENLPTMVYTDMSSEYDEKFVFHRMSSVKKLFEKLDKKDKKYLFVKVSKDDYEKVLSDVPDGFEPVKFGDGDNFKANVIDVHGSLKKKNMIMVLEPSSVNEKMFLKNNESFVKKTGLISSMKILDNSSIPDWAALPLKDNSGFYRVRASETGYAINNLNDIKKNYDNYAIAEAEAIQKEKNIIAEKKYLNDRIKEVSSQSDDPVFKEWLQEKIDEHDKTIDHKADYINRLKEDSKIKYSVDIHENFVEYAREEDNEYEGEKIANALDRKSEALGIKDFNSRKWLNKNNNVDLFSLRGAII